MVVVRVSMLLLEVPREATVGPPCLPPNNMSTLTKLNFTDYSAKINKQFSENQDSRLTYEHTLSNVPRLNYAQAQNQHGVSKHEYTDSRLSFDPSDSVCLDGNYAIATGKLRILLLNCICKYFYELFYKYYLSLQ